MLHPQQYGRNAPSNYVAGLGRGAVGFTTRSDIGPSQAKPDDAVPSGAMGPPGGGTGATGRGGGGGRGVASGGGGSMPAAPHGYVGGRGRGAGTVGRFGKERDGPGDKKGDYSESNYDEFSGFGGEKLFNDTPYDDDDHEADDVYKSIDDRMDSKRKRKREEGEKKRMAEFREERPKIADQFADVKAKLQEVSEDQWNAIPEVGDYSIKRRQRESFSAVPDSVIADQAAAVGGAGQAATLDRRQQKYGGFQTPIGGFSTPMGGFNTPMGGWRTPGGFTTPAGGGGTSVVNNLTGLSQAREQVLSLRLDKMSDSVSGQTVVDPKGYLTDLNSQKLSDSAEVGDIKKARRLLRSVTMTNPKHAPGWIAAARLERTVGKMSQARKIIQQGCETCPDSEDLWIEAAAMQTPENAKVVFANAVRHIPRSVKIWIAACELESDPIKKKSVLRRALEFVPNSVRLWRAAVELEDAEDAKILLSRAVECVPTAVPLWLAYARLCDYEEAKKILNRARRAVPTDPRIWISACKLEEAAGSPQELIDRLLQNAIKFLQTHNVVLEREQWLKEARFAEQSGNPKTATAIVKAAIDIGVEPEERRRVWLDDAKAALARGGGKGDKVAVQVARTIYSVALKTFPGKRDIWLEAVKLEQEHGTAERVEELLKQAVTRVPQEEILWLMAAKHKWRQMGDVAGARAILRDAFAANAENEKIWLAAVKLEWENGEIERARQLLKKARQRAATERVWMKSCLLEWQTEQLDAEEELLQEALRLYPSFDKLWMMCAQLYQEKGDVAKARATFHKGLMRCPHNATLWILAAELEEQNGAATKARSLLEIARLKNPNNAELFLAAIQLERRQGNAEVAEKLMATALQKIPTDGRLWVEEISMQPKKRQNHRSADALKKCDNDPHVVLKVAKIFWRQRKYKKARRWFNRAVTLRPDIGDAWAAYYKFEVEHGEDDGEAARAVLERCVQSEPNRGRLWCTTAKRRENRQATTAAILKKVAKLVTYQ